jgi:hypothetical protein
VDIVQGELPFQGRNWGAAFCSTHSNLSGIHEGVSRVIKEATEKKRIKLLDPATARRYMKYIPFWA